mgnify:CR=1 FL=1
MNERSIEGNGLPWLYLLKSLLLIQPILLMLQGLAEIIKNILILQGQSINTDDAQINGGQL